MSCGRASLHQPKYGSGDLRQGLSSLLRVLASSSLGIDE
jgi:hypothetical protein